MKKILIPILLLLSSCGNITTPSPAPPAVPSVYLPIDLYGMNNGAYKLITIDSCEYIAGWVGGSNGGGILTHKGNCKNPIHYTNN